MAGTSDADLWIRRFHPAGEGAPRLICLPHAGGSASYFFPLSKMLSPAVEVLSVQYPGRQDRRAEPCVDDLRELAARLLARLEGWTDPPPALFGHSMGATLAYEVTRLLEARGDAVRHLFLSGRRGPRCRREDRMHRMGDDELVAAMAALDGTDPRLLADPDVRAMLLPALRGDYRAIETYVHRAGPEPSCPVTALVGDDDPVTTPAEADAWRSHTGGPFELLTFPGGHFYLASHRAELTRLITSRLLAGALEQ
ncbi:alpha/beta fold hydrolase [Streptosporangium sp. NPDC023615]|uniref:thioesterase II family protein n=1 Tax=Streptosporangium sp. NPDC023615 TaxID=3154794 RepID=UPI0034456911